jgi:cytidine deaminase
MSLKIRLWSACPPARSEKWKEKRKKDNVIARSFALSGVPEGNAVEAADKATFSSVSRLLPEGSQSRVILMPISNQEKQALIDLANTARQRAYVPYSNYPVGAALRTKTGRIFTGVNVENAAYPQTMCAERVAVFKAVSEGEKEFEVISVVTDNGGSPCGGCRQVLAEFGLDTIVLLADRNGKLLQETTVKELLPEAFTPDHLRK